MSVRVVSGRGLGLMLIGRESRLAWPRCGTDARVIARICNKR